MNFVVPFLLVACTPVASLSVQQKRLDRLRDHLNDTSFTSVEADSQYDPNFKRKLFAGYLYRIPMDRTDAPIAFPENVSDLKSLPKATSRPKTMPKKCFRLIRENDQKVAKDSTDSNRLGESRPSEAEDNVLLPTEKISETGNSSIAFKDIFNETESSRNGWRPIRTNVSFNNEPTKNKFTSLHQHKRVRIILSMKSSNEHLSSRKENIPSVGIHTSAEDTKSTIVGNVTPKTSMTIVTKSLLQESEITSNKNARMENSTAHVSNETEISNKMDKLVPYDIKKAISDYDPKRPPLIIFRDENSTNDLQKHAYKIIYPFFVWSQKKEALIPVIRNTLEPVYYRKLTPDYLQSLVRRQLSDSDHFSTDNDFIDDRNVEKERIRFNNIQEKLTAIDDATSHGLDGTWESIPLQDRMNVDEIKNMRIASGVKRGNETFNHDFRNESEIIKRPINRDKFKDRPIGNDDDDLKIEYQDKVNIVLYNNHSVESRNEYKVDNATELAPSGAYAMPNIKSENCTVPEGESSTNFTDKFLDYDITKGSSGIMTNGTNKGLEKGVLNNVTQNATAAVVVDSAENSHEIAKNMTSDSDRNGAHLEMVILPTDIWNGVSGNVSNNITEINGLNDTDGYANRKEETTSHVINNSDRRKEKERDESSVNTTDDTKVLLLQVTTDRSVVIQTAGKFHIWRNRLDGNEVMKEQMNETRVMSNATPKGPNLAEPALLPINFELEGTTSNGSAEGANRSDYEDRIAPEGISRIPHKESTTGTSEIWKMDNHNRKLKPNATEDLASEKTKEATGASTSTERYNFGFHSPEDGSKLKESNVDDVNDTEEVTDHSASFISVEYFDAINDAKFSTVTPSSSSSKGGEESQVEDIQSLDGTEAIIGINYATSATKSHSRTQDDTLEVNATTSAREVTNDTESRDESIKSDNIDDDRNVDDKSADTRSFDGDPLDIWWRILDERLFPYPRKQKPSPLI